MATKENGQENSPYVESGSYAPGSYDEYLKQENTVVSESGTNELLSEDTSSSGIPAGNDGNTAMSETVSYEQAADVGTIDESVTDAATNQGALISKLRVGSLVTGLLSRLGGPIGKLAKALNVSMRLLTILLVLFGGSALTVLGITLFGQHVNPGRYVSLDECLDDNTPYDVPYTDNEEFSRASNPDPVVNTIYKYLSDADFINGVIKNGDRMENDPGYYDENGDPVRGHIDLKDAYTQWLPHNLGGVDDNGPGFTDEAILGMCANALAESGLRADVWECYWACFKTIDGVEQPLDKLSGGDAYGGQNLAMTSSHHRDWNSYVLVMREYWKECSNVGDIVMSVYRYHSLYDYIHKDEIIEERFNTNPELQAKYHGDAEAWWRNTDYARSMNSEDDVDPDDKDREGRTEQAGHGMGVDGEMFSDDDKENTKKSEDTALGDTAYLNQSGQVQYYPGLGLWAWTGAKSYALAMWANTLENVHDYDLDGMNDAMYELDKQIYYVVYENGGGFSSTPIKNYRGKSTHTVDGNAMGRLIPWGRADRATYAESFYVNIPNKPSNAGIGVGTLGVGDDVRTRYKLSGGSDVATPPFDYAYADDQLARINETALAIVWNAFIAQAEARYDWEDYGHKATEVPDYFGQPRHTGDLDNLSSRKKVEALMVTRYGRHAEVRGDEIVWVKDDYPYWYALNDYDLLDVSKAGTIISYDGTKWSCGDVMCQNLMSFGWSQRDCFMANLSIYDARLYYDISSEVTANNATTGALLLGADDMNDGGASAKRPDNAMYAGMVDFSNPYSGYVGDAIIYESSAENMTGHVADGGNIFGGDPDAGLLSHEWARDLSESTDGEKKLLLMMRPDGEQWGNFETYPRESMDEYPGWTRAVFNDWWALHLAHIGMKDYEHNGEFRYRRELASQRYSDDNETKIVPVVVDQTGAEDMTLAKDRLTPLRLWSQARAKAQVARLCAREYLCYWEGMGPSNLGFLNSHSQYQPILRWTTSLIEDEWQSLQASTENLLDIWHDHMSTAQLEAWQDTFYRRYCGNRGDMGFGGIAEMAVAMAYPNIFGKDEEEFAKKYATVNYPGLRWLVSSDCVLCMRCTELYCGIKDIVSMGEGGDGANSKEDWKIPNKRVLYSSCDRGACTAVKSSGADDNFPWGACEAQMKYLKEHSDIWEFVDYAWNLDPDELEPGDIIIKAEPDNQHIIVFVGGEYVEKKWGSELNVTESQAKYSVVHSALSKNNDATSRGLRCDIIGSAGPFFWRSRSDNYHVFRLKEEPDRSSSKYVALLESEKSYLGGLKNGTANGTGADWID